MGSREPGRFCRRDELSDDSLSQLAARRGVLSGEAVTELYGKFKGYVRRCGGVLSAC